MESIPSTSEFHILPEHLNANPSPSSLHVGWGRQVALQTVHAVIREEGDPYSIRVLLLTCRIG